MNKIPPTNLKVQFQTPPEVAKYMVGLPSIGNLDYCEPTPGEGNIVKAIKEQSEHNRVYTPKNFFKMKRRQYECIIMNPPFSEKYAFGIPENLDLKGMRLGYYMLKECMTMSNSVIALMPWFTITDSDVRLRTLKEFGLRSITALPRKTFGYTRIQTCVFELEKDYQGETAFKTFNY